MTNRFGDPEIKEWIAEYIDHKNPVFDKEWWDKINGPTLFDLNESLKGEKEDYEDNTPLDEEDNLCVDWFFDFKTGKLKEETFTIQRSFKVKNKTYRLISINKSNKTFIVDFENKVNFPWMEKWAKRYISSIESFGNKEIIIFSWFDNKICIDNKGNQIWKEYVWINKIAYGKIDILELIGRAIPEDNNSLETWRTYLWSDGKRYKPKFSEVEGWSITSFEVIPEQPKESTSIRR